MLVGFIVSGPVSGALSDRFGARAFATGGMLLTTIGFLLLTFLPGDFAAIPFFALLLLIGVGMGLFSAPNTTSIMNAVPPATRGVASGMRATFQNSGTMLSITCFFSILIAGLASSLPGVLFGGWQASAYQRPSRIALPEHHPSACSSPPSWAITP